MCCEACARTRLAVTEYMIFDEILYGICRLSDDTMRLLWTLRLRLVSFNRNQLFRSVLPDTAQCRTYNSDDAGVVCYAMFCDGLRHWRGGAAGIALDLRSVGRGFKSYSRQRYLGQVVHTYVPLSASSITWYRPKDGDGLRLGR